MGGNYYSLRGRDNRDLHCHGKKHMDLRGESNSKKCGQVRLSGFWLRQLDGCHAFHRDEGHLEQ